MEVFPLPTSHSDNEMDHQLAEVSLNVITLGEKSFFSPMRKKMHFFARYLEIRYF